MSKTIQGNSVNSAPAAPANSILVVSIYLEEVPLTTLLTVALNIWTILQGFVRVCSPKCHGNIPRNTNSPHMKIYAKTRREHQMKPIIARGVRGHNPHPPPPPPPPQRNVHTRTHRDLMSLVV